MNLNTKLSEYIPRVGWCCWQLGYFFFFFLPCVNYILLKSRFYKHLPLSYISPYLYLLTQYSFVQDLTFILNEFMTWLSIPV